MTKNPNNHSYNVLFTPNQYKRLTSLAIELDLPRAFVIRNAVMAYYNMACNQIPTCADGRKCLCPHLHPAPLLPQTPPPPTKDSTHP